MSDQRKREATKVDKASATPPETPKPDAARRARSLYAVDARDAAEIAGGMP